MNTEPNADATPPLRTTLAQFSHNKGVNQMLRSMIAEVRLDRLIGLEAAKSEVANLKTFLTMQRRRAEHGLRTEGVSRHLVFIGNPGTGKTTVARILGDIYKEAGFLSKGHCIETDRSGLVAEYIGQTAMKTRGVCEEARGGVLFIDEAYSLAPPDQYGNDFGKEAIETLLKFMEDNREDVVVVVAGYPEKMRAFIGSNPGLESRFNQTILFENYTPKELLRILEDMCDSGDYVLSDKASEKAYMIFEERCRHPDESFGNARYVRNLYQRAILEHSRRISTVESVSAEMLVLLQPADFVS